MSTPRVLVGLCCSVLVFACDSKKEPTGSGMASIASESLAVKQPQPAAAPSVQPAVEKKIVRRPGMEEALDVTDAIRSRVESRHPEAAGFLTGAQIEEKLFALDLKRGKDDDALKHVDRLAKGKWILLTGPVTAPQPEGFELPIRYTPRDPTDPMGLTSQWINVKLTAIQGYEATEYRPGEKAAVLARYKGNKEAAPGFDLILIGHWYE
jgi:hypothetical protein